MSPMYVSLKTYVMHLQSYIYIYENNFKNTISHTRKAQAAKETLSELLREFAYFVFKRKKVFCRLMLPAQDIRLQLCPGKRMFTHGEVSLYVFK